MPASEFFQLTRDQTVSLSARFLDNLAVCLVSRTVCLPGSRSFWQTKSLLSYAVCPIGILTSDNLPVRCSCICQSVLNPGIIFSGTDEEAALFQYTECFSIIGVYFTRRWLLMSSSIRCVELGVVLFDDPFLYVSIFLFKFLLQSSLSSSKLSLSWDMFPNMLLTSREINQPLFFYCSLVKYIFVRSSLHGILFEGRSCPLGILLVFWLIRSLMHICCLLQWFVLLVQFDQSSQLNFCPTRSRSFEIY